MLISLSPPSQSRQFLPFKFLYPVRNVRSALETQADDSRAVKKEAMKEG